MLTDIEIASKAKYAPINQVAEKAGIPTNDLIPYGRNKAKIDYSAFNSETTSNAKLILVTAMSPTPAGEGKTTTTVGLGDALNRIGKKTIICLREPSLGPVFGVKGGAAGGGYSQVIPMEDINLHFTGDFHAITSAHNLLSALIDNHIHWGNKLGFDIRNINWGRVMDMNDRSLRDCVIALGGKANGFPRQSGFDITVASEIMAILCLSNSLEDLENRIANITIGFDRDGSPIFAKALNAQGAMTALLKDALMPNLVQTLENNPAIIHGGPFANIAHGCNSVIATKLGMKHADYVVTEAGFGADLGAEKFIDIKCRKAGIYPNAVVIVATVRSLKMHGGVAKDDLKTQNVEALQKGFVNLKRHIENMKNFGLPVTVALNHFIHDTDEEVNKLKELCEQSQANVVLSKHWADGGAGAEELAHTVCKSIEGNIEPKFLYDDNLSFKDKVTKIATDLYRAGSVKYSPAAENKIKIMEKMNVSHYPVCIAKNQYSFSDNPKLLGAPDGHELNVRDITICTGAEFNVVICGAIIRMPGLPRVPSAEKISIDPKGNIQGLF